MAFMMACQLYSVSYTLPPFAVMQAVLNLHTAWSNYICVIKTQCTSQPVCGV